MNNQHPDHFKTDGRGMHYAGDHLLVELWDATHLADASFIERSLEQAARTAGATVLYSYYHPFGEGMGVSGVTILAESHISIHTWPERGYAAIDVFMCGDCDPQKTLPILESAFLPGRVETSQFKRGVIAPAAFQSVA